MFKVKHIGIRIEASQSGSNYATPAREFDIVAIRVHHDFDEETQEKNVEKWRVSIQHNDFPREFDLRDGELDKALNDLIAVRELASKVVSLFESAKGEGPGEVKP